MRSLGVINDRHRIAETRDDSLDGGQNELGVVVEIEFATPSVEELNGRDSGGDLAFEIENGGVGDFVEKFAKDFRLGVEEILYSRKPFFGAAFDHVTGQSPRRGSKAEDRDVGSGEFDGAAKSFHEEAGFDFRIEDVEFPYVGLGANWSRKVGTLVFELEGKAHGFGRDENVGKDDDGVDAEAAQGLNGYFECQIGSLADL